MGCFGSLKGDIATWSVSTGASAAVLPGHKCDGEGNGDPTAPLGCCGRQMGSATSQNHTLKITPFALHLVMT